MITITMYAHKNGSWRRINGFTRPFSGADKLDETLDSAITDLTLQPNSDEFEPFTKYKFEATDGNTTETHYFFIGGSESNKVRMG